MKEINETKCVEIFHVMDKNTHYCQGISSFQLGLQSPCNTNQNPSKLLGEH